jgi:AcrR family transcriptional regulator
MSMQLPETPQEKRRSQSREAARRAILDATEALLVADGYESFSMRRLAQRCGYTAPSIYHYFRDKAGLLDALIEERFGLLVDRIREVPSGGDAEDAVRGQLEAFVKFGLENPTHYRLLTQPRNDGSQPPQAAEQARALIEVSLSRLAAENRLLLDDIEEAVQCIWVMLHGLISLRISRPDYEWTPSHVDVCVDVLLRGLVSPSGRSTDSSAPDRRLKA